MRQANEQAYVDQKRREWWERERNRPFWDLQGVCVVGLILALLGTVLYMGAVLLVAGSVVLVWPYTVREMIRAYQGGAPLERVLLTALLAILIVTLVRDIRKTRATARAPWRNYIVWSILVTTVIGQCMDLSRGLAFGDTLLDCALTGFVLGLMPALILYYAEFRTQGYRGFAPAMAAWICCRVKGGGKVFLVMGVLELILALLMLITVLTEQPGATWGMVLAPLGVSLLSLYIGKAGE